ncbi:uncharacterized protein LOC116265462 isoform X2 [Nymphaea colorata]|uniref:uncharacterized protein LOC116265462 isoform X2 n=1 Tax=Nymphaea colorata TaxID=210225 RepID=UPI00214E9EEF|nr:uncharacterized protein LOC116265462 isoform X2 [Nymphaea colorata]
MDNMRKSSKSKQPLLNYKWVPRDIAYFDVIEIVGDEDLGVSDLHREGINCFSNNKLYDQFISTNKIMSTISGFWETIAQPSSILQSGNTTKYNNDTSITHPRTVEKLLLDASISRSEFLQICHQPIGPKQSSDTTRSVSPGPSIASVSSFLSKNGSRFSCLRETQDGMLSCTGIGQDNDFIFRKVIPDSSLSFQSLKDCGSTTPGFSCDLVRMYGYISNFPFFSSKHVTSDTLVNCEASDYETEKSSSKAFEGQSSGVKPTHLSKPADPFQGSSSLKTLEPSENISQSKTSLHAVYLIGETEKREGLSFVSELQGSSNLSDHHIKPSIIESDERTCKQPNKSCEVAVESQHVVHCSREKDDMLVNKGKDSSGEVIKNGLSRFPHLSMYSRVSNSPANEGYALAGALAGIFVSLWLHPVDTVKTVIQSRRMDQKSISHVLGTILSEKGLMGLYRGIGSNLVTSAPISAVYTFTYEAVKGAVVPLLPKEYHSFAHCTAGGCASIATSFIFTPSERIKQQMQVGSRYGNCWNALIGIIQKGGLSSLYAGWGAVLCRNIPHSIIKFYTYESLKQWASSSSQNCLQHSTLQTLICGGLAGSTAALFTTPFDVIKTRLQTQIPGSIKVYNGVFHALKDIANEEGLRGLYRLIGFFSFVAAVAAKGSFFPREKLENSIFIIFSIRRPLNILPKRMNIFFNIAS